jgi:RimJ/RimL family protein N-acetyltransferase
MLITQSLILSGKFVELEPLDDSHREDLRIIAQDESIWTYFPDSAMGRNFDSWFDKALMKSDNGRQLAFIVRRKRDHKVVGSTRYYDIEPEHRRLKVGYTWYITQAQGTAVNPESKLLLFTHAFEELNINRLALTTDARNMHSRAAIKKLGATEEGTLRQYMILKDGFLRDMVVFSILRSEWVAVKEKLNLRLTQY